MKLREKHSVLEEQVGNLLHCHGGGGAVMEQVHPGHDLQTPSGP